MPDKLLEYQGSFENLTEDSIAEIAENVGLEEQEVDEEAIDELKEEFPENHFENIQNSIRYVRDEPHVHLSYVNGLVIVSGPPEDVEEFMPDLREELQERDIEPGFSKAVKKRVDKDVVQRLVNVELIEDILDVPHVSIASILEPKGIDITPIDDSTYFLRIEPSVFEKMEERGGIFDTEPESE